MAAWQLRRRRLAVAYVFTITGVAMGSWAARTPDVKSQAHLGTLGWGAVNLVNALAGLAMVLVVTMAIARVGARPFVLVGVPLSHASLFACTFAHSGLHLALGLAAWGITGGALGATINTQAASMEQVYGRPIMVSFHACFSGGLLGGSLLTAALSHFGVGITLQFAVMQSVLLAGFALVAPMLPPDRLATLADEVRSGGASVLRLLRRLYRRFPRQLILLAAIASCSLVAEGSASVWGAVYVGKSLHAGDATGALAVSAFAAMQLAGRLVGDRFVARLGRSRFLVLCGLVASLGLAWGLASGAVIGGILAFGALGGGLAAVVPTTYGAAANQPELTAGEGVSAVVLLSQPAFVLGPFVIGWIASPTSVRVGLFLPVLTTLVLALLAFRLRDPGIRRSDAAPELQPLPEL
ncbi:MAG: MFS transporter [Gaiellaceae bacterium]